MAVFLYYVEKENPSGRAGFSGVPHRDLTKAEFDALPGWVQKSVLNSKMYQKTNPNPRHRQPTDDGGGEEPVDTGTAPETSDEVEETMAEIGKKEAEAEAEKSADEE